MPNIDWGEDKDAGSHARAVFRLYETYRAYIVREDILINERLQRMLIIHGFLFAAEGTVLPKFCENLDQWSYLTGILGFFCFSIAVCGAVAASLIRRALEAGVDASDHLEREWIEKAKADADVYGIPGLRGGGHPNTDQIGKNHILVLPKLFLIIWILLAIIVPSLFIASHWHRP